MGLEAGTTIDDLVATNPLSTDPRSEGDDHLRLIKAVLKADVFTKRHLPSGTRMLFNQTAAPTGWTKDATAALNDSALRIVTGAVASGGSLAFSAAFAAGRVVSGTTDGFAAGGTVNAGTTGATTLSVAQMPRHTHQEQGGSYGLGGHYAVSVANGWSGSRPLDSITLPSGGNGSHTHTTPAHSHSFTGTAHSHTLASSSLAMNVKYTDLIIATKD